MSWQNSIVLGIIALLSIEILALILKAHSTVPYLDAGTTVLSIIGQLLICRKKIETWFIWFAVDTMYIYLYFHKGIPFHGIMAAIYLIMAVMGFYRWQQKLTSGSTTLVADVP